MRFFLFTIFVALSSCGQNYNSNSNDGRSVPQGDCSTPAGVRLCAALNVINHNRCYNCHSSWTAYTTDAAWLASGLVTAGQPLSSTLTTKLVNLGGDMPGDTRTAIPDSDFNQLVTWIQNL